MAMTWGGSRKGAGRRARGPHSSEPHKTRPRLSPRLPVHVTARVVPALAGLNRRRSYQAIRRAIVKSFVRTDFRIVHLAVRRSGIELVLEADDKTALARGMQGLQVAAARSLNRAASRAGNVFPDRYRARILNTRAMVRAAIAHLPTSRSREAWPWTWLLLTELTRPSRRNRRSSA